MLKLLLQGRIEVLIISTYNTIYQKYAIDLTVGFGKGKLSTDY